MRDEEFEEEDVWSFANESEDSSSQTRKSKENSSGSSSAAWRFHSAPRMIRRTSNTPTATHESNKVAQQSSAPVNIPDWSKIYGKNVNFGSSSKTNSWVDGHGDGMGNGVTHSNGDHHGYDDDDDVDDDNEDDDGDIIPPHEWLARKLARNQISSFSVCEGIGRTLKGRDLSKVRNAILTKTGFLE
ncbi:Senescence regulator [Melia azedarach]|uniref:Senescence regulator n=1 Tax=Melia azedarach TaxID=155640 RepID=A0ACC1X127_MELAZ|nr:Senescence regulator [Melia azedarach]